MHYSFDRQFEYENGFYRTASVARISKFATHLELFKRASVLPGDIVECGVFKGNSLFRWIKFRNLFENCSSRKIVAFDTFSDFPPANFEIDQEKRELFIAETGGGQSISQKELTETLTTLNLNSNVELIAGNILETLPAYCQNNDHQKISLLHVDVDMYDATNCALEHLYPRVVRGGIVILDDYGAMPGANKAIDDYFANSPLQIQKLPFSNAISYVEKP